MPPGSLPDHSGVIEYGKGIFCPGNNKTQADPLIGGNNAFMAQEGFSGKRFVRYPGEFVNRLKKASTQEIRDWKDSNKLTLCSLYIISGYQIAAAPFGENGYFNSSEPKVKSCCLTDS